MVDHRSKSQLPSDRQYQPEEVRKQGDLPRSQSSTPARDRNLWGMGKSPREWEQTSSSINPNDSSSVRAKQLALKQELPGGADTVGTDDRTQTARFKRANDLRHGRGSKLFQEKEITDWKTAWKEAKNDPVTARCEELMKKRGWDLDRAYQQARYDFAEITSSGAEVPRQQPEAQASPSDAQVYATSQRDPSSHEARQQADLSAQYDQSGESHEPSSTGKGKEVAPSTNNRGEKSAVSFPQTAETSYSIKEKEEHIKENDEKQVNNIPKYIKGQKSKWKISGQTHHVEALDALDTKEEKEEYIRNNVKKRDNASSSDISSQRKLWERRGKKHHVEALDALDTKEKKEEYIRNNVKKRGNTSSSYISSQRDNWKKRGPMHHVEALDALDTKEKKEEYIRNNIKKR